MKANPDEATVNQTVKVGDLPPLPPVTMRRCAWEVKLDQLQDGELVTVSIEFDSLQKVRDILKKMQHDHDLEDWNSIVGG
jgi:hypothetical protein